MVKSRGRVLAHNIFGKNNIADSELKKEAKNATSLTVAKIDVNGIDKIIWPKIPFFACFLPKNSFFLPKIYIVLPIIAFI